MKRILTAFAITATLAACADLTFEQKSQLKDVGLLYIESLNAAGVDPLQMSDDRLQLVNASCIAATTAMQITDAEYEVVGYCDLVAKALSERSE